MGVDADMLTAQGPKSDRIRKAYTYHVVQSGRCVLLIYLLNLFIQASKRGGVICFTSLNKRGGGCTWGGGGVLWFGVTSGSSFGHGGFRF
jgi:hypothetical protein